MRKFIAIIVVIAACGCLFTSCNEKPKYYRFVKVMPDGTEQVQEITAKNDTDALKHYLSEMEKTIMANIDKADSEQLKAMYVISPKGDTLNTNNELLEAVVKGDGSVITMKPISAQPVEAAAPAPGQKPAVTPLQKKGTATPAAPAK